MSLLLRPLRLVALVVLLGIGGGAFWAWHSAAHSTPVSGDRALAEFRALGLPPTAARRGTPASGVYRYRAEGSETAGSGPLSVQRDLPAEAVYVITPYAGGYHEDLELSREHVEEAHFVVGSRGTSATWRRTKVTFLGIGEDSADDVAPPSLDHPHRLRTGDHWGGHYRLGGLEVEYAARVTGRETAQLDGRAVPVAVMQTDTTFSGETDGTRTDVVRWSPALSLPVTWSIRERTSGASDYAIDARLTLVSGRPER